MPASSNRKSIRELKKPGVMQELEINREALKKIFADRNANHRPTFCQGPKCSKSSHATLLFEVGTYTFCESCADRYNKAKESKREKALKAQQAREQLGWGQW